MGTWHDLLIKCSVVVSSSGSSSSSGKSGSSGSSSSSIYAG